MIKEIEIDAPLETLRKIEASGLSCKWKGPLLIVTINEDSNSDMLKLGNALQHSKKVIYRYQTIKNIRYVVSYINREGMRKMLGAAQGRNTMATKAEADKNLKAILKNNTAELLIETYGKDGYETLAVSAIECWPVHNDPKGIWIQEELNPGQEILRGEIKNIMKRLK